MGKFWKRHKEKLWAPFEVSLLLIALMSPVIFTSHSPLRGKLFGKVLVSSEFLAFDFDENIRSIASKVLEIPITVNSEIPAQVVSVRQVRLELSGSENKILSVERLLVGDQEAGWESIPLLLDKETQKNISTFIELGDGENVFRIEYKTPKGVFLKVPLVVNHIKRDKT